LSPNITGNVMPDLSIRIGDMQVLNICLACFNKLEEVKEFALLLRLRSMGLGYETTSCFYISR